MGAVLNHFTMSVKTISDCCDQMESCCFDDRSKAVCHQTPLKKCAKDEKLGKTSEDDKCAGDKCCHTDQLIVDKCCGSEKGVEVGKRTMWMTTPPMDAARIKNVASKP